MKAWMRMLMLALAMTMVCSGAMACDGCGYPDINPWSTDIPSFGQLNIDAYLLGDEVIGRTAHVLRSGEVFAEPTKESEVLTEAFKGDKLAILDYEMETVDPLSIWLKVDFFGMEGWFNAGRVQITSCTPDAYIEGSDPELEALRSRYVGQRMMINAGSAKAHAGVGEEFPAIEYVRRDEVYQVHAAELDAEGKPWFMIRIGSRECWVRAGLMSYIGE